jgi:superfamily II DNA/RNA helicase
MADSTKKKKKVTKKSDDTTDAPSTTVKKTKKKQKTAESEEHDVYGYGDSRFNIEGVSWQNVSLQNMSLDQTSKIAGFVSLQVTDGSAYNKRYKGVVYQNEETRRKHEEEQKALMQPAEKKRKKPTKDTPKPAQPQPQPQAAAAPTAAKKQKLPEPKSAKPAKNTKLAAPVAAPVVEEVDEEEMDEEDEDDLSEGDGRTVDDMDEDEIMAMLADGESEEEDMGDFDQWNGLEGEEGDWMLLDGMEGDEGDMMMMMGEGDDEEDMMELADEDAEMEMDEDEEVFFADEDEDEMEFEEVREAPTLDLDAIAEAEAKKKAAAKEQKQKAKEAKKAVVAAEPTNANTNTPAPAASEPAAVAIYDDVDNDDTSAYDPLYAASPAASFFHHNPDYVAWVPYNVHPLLMRGIRDLGFKKPMPIQAECMLPAMRDWKDLVGAAQTGSGKTLAFAMPILQTVIENRTFRGEDYIYELKRQNKAQGVYFRDELTAIILTPTRELAVQIAQHMDQVAKHAYIRCVSVVGGLAQQKQARLLALSPSVIVATPGRLWDLISEGKAPFDDLTRLRYFVLDEADRMIASGRFTVLENIIAYIQSFRDDQSRIMDNDKIKEREQRAETAIQKNRMLVPVDAKGQELSTHAQIAAANELMDRQRRRKEKRKQQQMMDAEEDEDEEEEEDEDDDDEYTGDLIIEDTTGLFKPEDFEDNDVSMMFQTEDAEEDAEEDGEMMADEDMEEDAEQEQDDEEEDEDEEEEAAPVRPKVQRMQISATLTIKDEGRGTRKEMQKRQKRNGKPEEDSSTAGKAMLQELAHRLPFGDKPHIVDFSSQYLLAPGLSQVVMECLDADRDVYLYSQLYVHNKSCIIFTNSIKVVKRLTNVLRALGYSAFPLHANMQQNQRLSVVDKLRKNPRTIIVSTDVAARGLDIPNVELVIQYHVPSDPETYVHRAGRTARANTQGRNIVLVTPPEQPDYRRLVHVLGPAALDIQAQRPNFKYLQHLGNRLRLAQRVAAEEEKDMHEAQHNKWLKTQSDAIGLDLGGYDGIEAVHGKKIDEKMNAKQKRELGKNNRAMNELNKSRRKHEDDDDFSENVRQHKRRQAEVAQKKHELKLLLQEKIWTKGEFFY